MRRGEQGDRWAKRTERDDGAGRRSRPTEVGVQCLPRCHAARIRRRRSPCRIGSSTTSSIRGGKAPAAALEYSSSDWHEGTRSLSPNLTFGRRVLKQQQVLEYSPAAVAHSSRTRFRAPARDAMPCPFHAIYRSPRCGFACTSGCHGARSPNADKHLISVTLRLSLSSCEVCTAAWIQGDSRCLYWLSCLVQRG
jgi:hypothetical protein